MIVNPQEYTEEEGLITLYDANYQEFNQLIVQIEDTKEGYVSRYLTTEGEEFFNFTIEENRIVNSEAVGKDGDSGGKVECLGAPSTYECIRKAAQSCETDGACLALCVRYIPLYCAASVNIACAVSCNN